MKVIEEAFEPITGYLISIERDTVHGWYFLKVGIPKGWVFNENGEISCEIITETTNGKLIQISPKNEGVVIDDLVDFVKVILETNEKIAQKEKEFTDKMMEMRNRLEEEAKSFYKELDELRDNSFKKNSDTFVKNLQSQKEEKKKVGRPRKEEVNVSSPTEQTTIHTTE
jgi:hypothetical protein